MNTHGIHRADNIHGEIPLPVQLLQLTGKHTETRGEAGNQPISVYEYSRIQSSNFIFRKKLVSSLISQEKIMI